ncbi:MAG TPA: pimeloyl-ACP methyl ester esterase BioH [Pseudomonadales bacterium]
MQLYHDIFKPTGCSEAAARDIVLLHGWGMNSLVWDEVIPELLKQHRVTVIDLPGLGRSPVPGGDYNLDYLSRHVAEVAPEKAIWMGWSLGGLVAMNIAIQHPEKVSALVSVAGTPSFVVRNDQAGEWHCAMSEKIIDGFIDIFAEDAQGTLIRFLALQCKGSPTIRQDIKKLKDMVYFYGLPAPQALRGGLKILREEDLRASIGKINCPTLFVLGRHDNLVPPGVSQAIHRYLPSAEVAIIEAAAHAPMISNPEPFLNAVNEFFQKMQ